MHDLNFEEVKKLSEGQTLSGYEKDEIIKQLASKIVNLDLNDRLEEIKDGLNTYANRLKDVDDDEAQDVSDGLDTLSAEIEALMEDCWNVLQ